VLIAAAAARAAAFDGDVTAARRSAREPIVMAVFSVLKVNDIH
jgi:hypothetical protein